MVSLEKIVDFENIKLSEINRFGGKHDSAIAVKNHITNSYSPTDYKRREMINELFHFFYHKYFI